MRKLNNVIVTRKLHHIVPGGKISLVRIGRPRKVSDIEWKCPFHITNIGMHEIQFAHGIDALQSLIQAIEGSRVFLEKSGITLSWAGGEEGETGLPRYVPTIYGKEFADHLHKLIDCEIEKFARSARKRYTAKLSNDKKSVKGKKRVTVSRQRRPPEYGGRSLTYDGVGNRLTENTNSYTYMTGTNKLSSANGRSFGYDNNGNTTTEAAYLYVQPESTVDSGRGRCDDSQLRLQRQWPARQEDRQRNNHYLPLQPQRPDYCRIE